MYFANKSFLGINERIFFNSFIHFKWTKTVSVIKDDISFNGKLYEQLDGMCMGSNLGPAMAAFTMHMVETKYTIEPLFYARYVDDILVLFNHKH